MKLLCPLLITLMDEATVVLFCFIPEGYQMSYFPSPFYFLILQFLFLLVMQNYIWFEPCLMFTVLPVVFLGGSALD